MDVGLVLQILGSTIALGAFLRELFAELTVEGPQLTAAASNRPNPWATDTGVRYRSPTASDMERYRREPSSWLKVTPAPSRGTDPELMALADLYVENTVAREKLLAVDWQKQKRQDDETRAELVRLYNEQSRLVAEQQARTRRRVLAEMAGLVLVAVGTVLSGI